MVRGGGPPTATEPWKKPKILLWVIFVGSIATIMLSYLGDRSPDWGELLYDLGVGVGIATVVSYIVSTHLENLDKLHMARHKAIQDRLGELRSNAEQPKTRGNANPTDSGRTHSEALRSASPVSSSSNEGHAE
jgi:hypothetical protein